MRPSQSKSSRSSSRYVEVGDANPLAGLPDLVTTFLLALILLIGPLVLGAVRLWLQLPLLGLVAILLLVQGFRLVSKPAVGVVRQIDAIDLSVVLFVLYTIVRWLTSPTEYFSRIEAMDVLAYAGIFFTCRYGLRHRKLALVLIYLLVALGLFEVGFGYYLSNHLDWFPFGSTERLHVYYAPRWVGTYGCPNHYGSLLVMAIGGALALGCFSKLAWPLRIVLIYLVGVMLVGVMSSGSRGTWLSLLVSTGAFMIFGLRNGAVRWWVPITGTLVLLVSAVSLFSMSATVKQRFKEGYQTVHSGELDRYVRIQLAEDALHIAHDNPLFGTGPGTFVFIHPRYQSSTFAFKAVLTHDDYLNCLDDYGLVGFAIAIFFVALVSLKLIEPLRAEHRWQDRVVIATGFAAWWALVVHSLLDFNLHIPANALFLFALTGLALSRLTRGEVVRHWSTLSLASLGPWLGWAVVLLSLLFVVEAGRTAMGDIIYEQTFANALEIPVSESIRDAENGLAYDPGNANDLILLGDLYYYEASHADNIEGRVSEGQMALTYYRRALKANSIDDTVQARIGQTLDVMRRYPEAYFSYELAVTAQPYNGQFWYYLGNHYWERGMLGKAEQAYLRSEQCPHGGAESVEAENELRQLPEMQGVPLPEGAPNPVQPSPPITEHEPTIP